MRRLKSMRRLMIPIIIALVFTVMFQLLRMGTVVNWTHPENTVNSLSFDNRIEEVEPLINKNTLVVFDENSALSETLLEKTETALNYVKKDYTVATELENDGLDNVDLLIVATGSLENIGDLNLLINYIDAGGDVLFLTTFNRGVALNAIKRRLGIYEYGREFSSNSFDIEEGFFKDESMIVEEMPWTSQALYVRLLEKTNVYIKDKVGNPLLWDYMFNKGSVMVANGTYFAQNGCAALLVKAVTHFDDLSIYPVINAGVFMLEGFPISMDGNLNWLKTYYSRDIEGFVRDLWWPDVMKVASTNGIKYTAGMYGVNALETNPPFYVHGHEVSGLAYYGLDLIRQGNELAISGYSPVAMITEADDYENVKKWSVQNMYDALNYIKEYSAFTFKNYDIRSYIAPNGVLTKTSLEAVKKALKPSVISLALEGDEKKQLVKTFEVKDDLVWFPIISKGYETISYDEFLITSFANSYGVLSHEISFWKTLFENDTLETPEMWETVRANYSKFVKQINKNYSWMDFTTISEAAQKQINHDAMDMTYEFREGRLHVKYTGIDDMMSFMLKTDKIVKPSKAYSIKKIDDTHYLITVSAKEFSIILEGK